MRKILIQLTILIVIPVASFSQAKKLATEKEITPEARQEAIDERLKEDREYTSLARPDYNRGSWIGGNYAELLKAWGAPARTVSDGQGGIVAVYENTNSYSSGSYTPGYTVYNGYGQVVAQQRSIDTRSTSTYQKQTTVYVDKDNKITDVKYEVNSNTQYGR